MAVSWHSFDLVSGRRGPRVETAALGSVERIIGEACSTSLEVVVVDPRTGLPSTGWEPATRFGLTMLVAIEESEDDETILWGGVIVRRVRTGPATVGVTVVTLEHYLQCRYTGDLDWEDADATTIAADTAAVANVDGLGFVIAPTLTGTTLSASFGDFEDRTVASVLEALMGLDGGIEFTVDLAWADAEQAALTKTLRIGPRIGTKADDTSQWTMPGCLTDFEYVEDFSLEFGANDVTAVSSGEGDSRPSARVADEALVTSAGWPRYERRFTPTTSITSEGTLESYAAAELARTRLGLTQLSVSAHLDSAPRLGLDWWLGDDITVSISAPSFPEVLTADGSRVPGYTRRLRVVGYRIDLDKRTLTPLTREAD